MNSDFTARYGRQIALPGVGREGQARLARARVLVIGAGGLGSPAALYLAGAGVGHLGLADFDRVELTNLHRQILYRACDEGASKVERAAETLAAFNPEVKVTTHELHVDAGNVDELVRDYDLVIDGTDDLATRGLVHDACYRSDKTYILGAVYRFEGQVAVFSKSQDSCLRCLYPEAERAAGATCNDAGTLGTVTGVIGSLQATEALKIILGVGEPLYRSLLVYDALTARTRSWRFERRADCALCSGETVKAAAATFDLEEFLAENPSALIVDLREQKERSGGTLPGAHAVPLAILGQESRAWKTARPILLYCQRGARSSRGAALLASCGFPRVYDLAGGYAAYDQGLARVIAVSAEAPAQ